MTYDGASSPTLQWDWAVIPMWISDSSSQNFTHIDPSLQIPLCLYVIQMISHRSIKQANFNIKSELLIYILQKCLTPITFILFFRFKYWYLVCCVTLVDSQRLGLSRYWSFQRVSLHIWAKRQSIGGSNPTSGSDLMRSSG